MASKWLCQAADDIQRATGKPSDARMLVIIYGVHPLMALFLLQALGRLPDGCSRHTYMENSRHIELGTGSSSVAVRACRTGHGRTQVDAEQAVAKRIGRRDQAAGLLDDAHAGPGPAVAGDDVTQLLVKLPHTGTLQGYMGALLNPDLTWSRLITSY